MTKKPCYVFDIDGTLSDLSHRLHHIQRQPKDWDAFFDACVEDDPIQHICSLARNLSHHHDVVFVSGRSDRVRIQTDYWLKVCACLSGSGLYMRRDGDFRADDIVKLELLAQLRSDGFEPVMAFDDRDRVVAMWRAAGIPCAQVAPGDF